MSNGKRHPKVPLILVPTGGVGVDGPEADYLKKVKIALMH
jgi:hypothetical protein